jgi:hypothetical protein
MILAWLVYPLVLAALGAGWGILVEKGASKQLPNSLVIPVGLVAVIVVAGLFTAFSGTAKVAVPVCAAGAVAGLAWGARDRAWRRLELWPVLAAIGVLLMYGAPVLLSGHATWLGYLRLDDTATWFNVADNVFAHGRSVAGIPKSTYTLVYTGDVGPSYPLGSFMIFGVGRALTGSDLAWVFDPYLAVCGAAIAMCVYALAEPYVASPRRRALVAFLGAQPALLYGYYLWGGIKEVTAAFVLAVGMTLAARVLVKRPERGRELLPLAASAGALITTLSIGAIAWIGPAFVTVLAAWLWHGRSEHKVGWIRAPLVSSAWLAGLTAACAVPMWVVLSNFLSNDSWLFSAGENTATRLGNLIQPLSGFQLAGVWTTGDFRLTASAFPTAPLIAIVFAAVAAVLVITVRRRQFGLLLFAGVALAGCAIFALIGSTPWVMGKALAISSPALLTVALIGAAMLWNRNELGVALVVVIGFGVMWSNLLGYHDALLAPANRMAELSHIGGLVAGKGPTFINDYEVYADRHFLRSGAPTEPAEYRYADLPTTRGVLLVKTAYADLDSFPLSTLLSYRSIVIRDSPVESRPPSIYKLIWQGRYYALYQRPASPTTQIVEHVGLGDQESYPYCGNAENGQYLSLCSVAPASIPSCKTITSLASVARNDGGSLVAYQRPLSTVVLGDDLQWPGAWYHDSAGHTLTPYTPGTAVAHIVVPSSQEYEFWLGGSFTRGFEVSVNGHSIGQAKDQIFDIDGYVPMAKLYLKAGIVNTVDITDPSADTWTPGTGNNEYTMLSSIALQPLQSPQPEMLTASPQDAKSLCGRPLDWIEVVKPT